LIKNIYLFLNQHNMKKITSIIAMAIVLFLLARDILAQTQKASLTGVWKYELDGWEGMAIFSPTHFIWVLTDKTRQPFTNQTPTIPQKAKAYEAINSASGTWELELDNRGKNKIMYASDPRSIGHFVRYDFEMVGNEFNYWVIQPDGSRGAPGKCRKLADWNASSDINMFNGVWEYIGQKGLYLQAGNYGAWYIQNGMQPETGSDEGKAKNFDAVNSSVALATNQGGNRQVWNVLHSSNAWNEKNAIFTTSEFTNQDLLKMWLVDPMSKKIGEGFQLKRIGK
jgi:hypothetical protein